MDLENPEIKRWEDGGIQCWGVTAEYKQALIVDYALRHGCKDFVETGTWHGDTVAAVRPYFDLLYSIELSPVLHAQNEARFVGCHNVYLYQGDSGIVLKDLLTRLDLSRPKVFWLDAHPSGGDTVGLTSPLESELDAIFQSGAKGVILIDDLQDCWQHDWAATASRVVAQHYGWQQEIKHGIMRVTHEG